jgi:hypothetical protein
MRLVIVYFLNYRHYSAASTSDKSNIDIDPQRKLFVWGNNDKWQLGMDNGLSISSTNNEENG